MWRVLYLPALYFWSRFLATMHATLTLSQHNHLVELYIHTVLKKGLHHFTHLGTETRYTKPPQVDHSCDNSIMPFSQMAAMCFQQHCRGHFFSTVSNKAKTVSKPSKNIDSVGTAKKRLRHSLYLARGCRWLYNSFSALRFTHKIKPEYKSEWQTQGTRKSNSTQSNFHFAYGRCAAL